MTIPSEIRLDNWRNILFPSCLLIFVICSRRKSTSYIKRDFILRYSEVSSTLSSQNPSAIPGTRALITASCRSLIAVLLILYSFSQAGAKRFRASIFTTTLTGQILNQRLRNFQKKQKNRSEFGSIFYLLPVDNTSFFGFNMTIL